LSDLLHPPHVSQLCGAKARSTGLSCKRWASIGYTRCKFHGGAKGSGRPKIHGKRSAQAARNAQFLRVVKAWLSANYKKPTPILVPAPPALLQKWDSEASRHVCPPVIEPGSNEGLEGHLLTDRADAGLTVRRSTP
jgi:hypothetical protein